MARNREYVVLVDEDNREIGTAPKSAVHTDSTPLHRAFSIFLFNAQGQLLLQQRATSKKTWPGVWSNSCCGHPGPNEDTQAAAKRRLKEELGLGSVRLWNVLPGYRYRAELHGIVENEICPVFVGFTDEQPAINPEEVEATRWIAWEDFQKEVKTTKPPYSPWCVEETALLMKSQEFQELFAKYTNGADIEQAIQQIFPKKWEVAKINRFIKSSQFTLDVNEVDQALNQPIRDILFRGGKRIRPRLFLALLKGFGKDPKPFYNFAVLLEAVHNGTLVVDDIEDSSNMRRGRPALHKKFGVDVAINAGNALYFLPLYALLQANDELTDTQRLKLYNIYSEEMIHVHFGQALDIRWHTVHTSTILPEAYFEMARLKTGALTRMVVRFASVLADQSYEVEQALTMFAELAGIAYQIKDDVLDLTANTQVFGKPPGGDITEGKMSLPVIFALAELPEQENKRLREILHLHTREEGNIQEARDLILKTSAVNKAMKQAEQFIQEAWNAVEHTVPAGEGRDVLRALVSSFTKRDY